MRIKILNNTFFFTAIFLLAVLFSCDAPRLNPLDPNNENNLEILEGQVFNRSYKPLPGVKITWEAGGQFTSSDINGRFAFGPFPKKPGLLLFEKEGFAEDSVFIDWDTLFVPELIFLNSIPVIDSLEFYSSVENQSALGIIRYYINSKLKLIDTDNDIKSVYITQGGNVLGYFDENTGTGFYSKNFEYSESSLEKLIGKDFQLWVTDTEDKNLMVGKSNIKRIIKQGVDFNSMFPKSYDTVSVPFKLSWDRFLPGFSFNYHVQIYRQNSDFLVWQQAVHPDSISLKITEPIPPGDYYWTIWSIDEFLNRNRSKPASFRIE